MIKRNGIILNQKNKRDLLSYYLHQAYCCHRRCLVLEMKKQDDAVYYAFKIKSAKGEMNKYIDLAQNIANQLNIDWIDWSEPKKFIAYLFD